MTPRDGTPPPGQDLSARLTSLIRSVPPSARPGLDASPRRAARSGPTADASPDGSATAESAPVPVPVFDAALMRLDPATDRALGVAATGGSADAPAMRRALAEAHRRVCTAGAVPHAALAPVPGDLEDACRALGLAVTDGLGAPGRAGTGPAAVEVLGALDDAGRATPVGWRAEGLALFLLGTTAPHLAGTAWERAAGPASTPPGDGGDLGREPDWAAERNLGQILVSASRDGMADAAHALGAGGLLCALAECVGHGGVGARIVLEDLCVRDGIDLLTALVAETPGRVLVAVPRTEEVRFTDMCTARKMPLARIGVTTGDVLEIQGILSLTVAELRSGARKD